MALNRLIWAAFWVGITLILLSWLNMVSTYVGWIGLYTAAISIIVAIIANRYWIPPDSPP